MRLHSRMVKPAFWTDTELIRQFSRDERLFYQGLWQLADDSGCLDNDPWAFKLHLFPLDADVTPEVLGQWTAKLLTVKKLIPYDADGKQCLFLVNFGKHQTIKNASAPEVPLPEWVTWETYPTNSRAGHYTIDPSKVPTAYASLTPCLPSADEVLLIEDNMNINIHEQEGAQIAPNGAHVNGQKKSTGQCISDGFASFWNLYPRKIAKDPASKAYQKALKAGVEWSTLIRGARYYAEACRQNGTEPRFILYPATFLNQRRYEDYQEALAPIAKSPPNGISRSSQSGPRLLTPEEAAIAYPDYA